MWREFVALAYLVRVFCSRRSAVGFAVVALCTGLLAQAAVAGDATATKTTTTTNTTTTTTTSWGGLSWGIGVAADFDIGGKRVNDATIVNNIVRVSDTSKNVGVGFVLEAHYFLKAKEIGGRACAPLVTPIDAFNCSDVATGPFVAIEVGGGSASTPDAKGPITAYAMGWMVGLRHPSASISPTSSWNFGVGLRVEPGAKTLGDGLIANQALPVGDSIRFKTEPRYGLMLLSSFSF
jgi:hypothetical protein